MNTHSQTVFSNRVGGLVVLQRLLCPIATLTEVHISALEAAIPGAGIKVVSQTLHPHVPESHYREGLALATLGLVLDCLSRRESMEGGQPDHTHWFLQGPPQELILTQQISSSNITLVT